MRACVEVPEQPLYFSDTERPLTSLQIDVSTSQSESKSRRHGSAQLVVPGVMTSRDADMTPRLSTRTKRRYNLRRLNELPYHLVRCRRTQQLLDEVTSLFTTGALASLVHFVVTLRTCSIAASSRAVFQTSLCSEFDLFSFTITEIGLDPKM